MDGISQTTKLRVGFLIDSLSTNQYVADLVELINENENFERPILITGYANKSVKKNIKEKILLFFKSPSYYLKWLLLKIIRKIETRIVQKEFPKYGLTIDIKTSIKNYDLIRVSGIWSKSKLFLEFSKDDISLISKYKIDCIIRCGSGILRGEIINISKFGIISFHHGDNQVNRGGPSGFWEVLNDEPSSGFVIQKINEELDGGEILFRGNLMTRNIWLKNNAQLLEKSNFFMKKLLLNLAKNRSLPKSEGVRINGNKLYKIDTPLPLLKYIKNNLFPLILNSIKNKLNSPKVSIWSLAYSSHNNFKKSLWRYTEVKNPPGRFLADPFIIEHNGENFIFFEDYLFCDKKGRISAAKINDDKFDFLDIVLEEKFHLSFPFIFKDGDNIYMLPETSKNRDIRLYKSINFPYDWELETILMSDLTAADTMVFKRNNTWFMLTNICSANYGDHMSELHIFYSDKLNTKKWKSIEQGNPVIFDPLRARNGGIFLKDGILYRVNQIHGKSHYGKSFCINEIKEISKKQYIENPVCKIDPNFMNGIISTHHFHANEKYAVVDFMRIKRLKSRFA